MTTILTFCVFVTIFCIDNAFFTLFFTFRSHIINLFDLLAQTVSKFCQILEAIFKWMCRWVSFLWVVVWRALHLRLSLEPCNYFLNCDNGSSSLHQRTIHNHRPFILLLLPTPVCIFSPSWILLPMTFINITLYCVCLHAEDTTMGVGLREVYVGISLGMKLWRGRRVQQIWLLGIVRMKIWEAQKLWAFVTGTLWSHDWVMNVLFKVRRLNTLYLAINVYILKIIIIFLLDLNLSNLFTAPFLISRWSYFDHSLAICRR